MKRKYQSKAERLREERPVYVPKVGHSYNPLLQFPRNHFCFCGSGEKFKRCCLNLQPAAIPTDWADRIKQCWSRIMSGALRIVPPSHPEATRAQRPDIEKAMHDMSLVPANEEGMLARSSAEADLKAVIAGAEGKLAADSNRKP